MRGRGAVHLPPVSCAATAALSLTARNNSESTVAEGSRACGHAKPAYGAEHGLRRKLQNRPTLGGTVYRLGGTGGDTGAAPGLLLGCPRSEEAVLWRHRPRLNAHKLAVAIAV